MKNEIEIYIDKSPKEKIIILSIISLLILGLFIMSMLFSYSIFQLLYYLFIYIFNGYNDKYYDVDLQKINLPIYWAVIILILTIIIIITIVFLLLKINKRKKEVIGYKEIRKKCIQCNNEYYNGSNCDHCGHKSSVEITCDNCYAINDLENLNCIKCDKIITENDLINQLNKKISINIFKLILIIVLSFILFHYIISVIISIIVGFFYYKRIKIYLNILEIIQKKNVSSG